VPVIEAADAWPSPEIVAAHDAYGLSKPPAGMLTEKWSDELDTEPAMVPRPLIPVLVSVIVTVPDTVVSD
jgi:hypothetical protein